MTAVHPDHFAAEGKRVASVFDYAQLGTVIKNTGGPHDPVVVRWDHGTETLTHMHELDIPLD